MDKTILLHNPGVGGISYTLWLLNWNFNPGETRIWDSRWVTDAQPEEVGGVFLECWCRAFCLSVHTWASAWSVVGPAGRACLSSLLITSLSVWSTRKAYGQHSYLSQLLPFPETSLTLSPIFILRWVFLLSVPTAPCAWLYHTLYHTRWLWFVCILHGAEHYFSAELSFISVTLKPNTVLATW